MKTIKDILKLAYNTIMAMEGYVILIIIIAILYFFM